MRPFADPEVAYVCGQLRIVGGDGRNKEGVYWRYEMGVRAAESRLGSVTGGNGSIYALRRTDYVEVDPRYGHDLSLPYRMVQKGRRAVYAADAQAFENATPTNETEYRRKVRMFEHCWLIVLRGKMLRRQPPGYVLELVSHRHLRYASGLLHVVLLGVVDRPHRKWVYDAVLAVQLGCCSPRPSVSGSRATTCSSPGRRSSRSGTTCAAACPRRGRRRRARAEPRARCRDRRNRPRGRVARPGARRACSEAEDGGPVLYRQMRVGKDGVDFELLKLRTMIVGAEKPAPGGGERGDERITRVGRLLRRLSLDELPQLWNVVRGEMSIIGPRPTLRYQVDRYDERQRHRLDVKPGITGWAQIHGRATLPWAERIELDLWYVRHRDWKTDLLILLRTPLALFGGTYKGATGGWRDPDTSA